VLVIAVVGRKKSGKTTIVEGVTGALTKLGCRVAVLKHIHHDDFDVDVPGKDTWRASRAGAVAVVGTSRAKTFLELHEPLDLRSLLGMIDEIVSPDVVLLEGFSGEIGAIEGAYVISLGGRDFGGNLLCECSGPGDLERAIESVEEILWRTDASRSCRQLRGELH
jgi:molybdopterin-guanine dinucleotide biosynthesis protein